MEMNRDQRLRKWWYDLLSYDMRSMGSVGAEKAVHYIRSQVEELGIESQVQNFAYPGWELVSFTGLHVESPVKETVEAYPALGSAGGKVVSGRLVELGETVIWDMYNWPRFGVFSDNGEIIAYITARLGGQALSQTLMTKDSIKPHLFVGEDTYWQWKEHLKQNEEILVSFELNVLRSPEKEGQNLRVQLYGAEDGDKSGKVIIGAHYDTMYNTKGAYDNTSGVAVLLGLIEWFQVERPPFSVECVFFGGEEFALAGSNAYVDSLSEKEREEIALMINLDGFGRGDILECWVSGERLEQNLWRQLMEEKERLFSRWKMVSPPPPGSDHTPFFNIGIPVVMFTVNDQEIIHTIRDLPQESMFHNMVKILQFLQIILKRDSKFE
jgi:Iap family predicted aminopeptidase